MTNVPVIAVTRSLYHSSVMAPLTGVPHLPPAVVYGPKVIRVVAEPNVSSESDSNTAVMVVPGVPNTWKDPYSFCVDDAAPN